MPPIPTSRSMRYAEMKWPAGSGPDWKSWSGAGGSSTCELTMTDATGAHHVPARLAAISLRAPALQAVLPALESAGSWIAKLLARFVQLPSTMKPERLAELGPDSLV